MRRGSARSRDWGAPGSVGMEGVQPTRIGPAVLPSKLRPVVNRSYSVPVRLRRRLQPSPGQLILVHAAERKGKTTENAGTQQPGWLWYNLDSSDSDPRRLAGRLVEVLGVGPLPLGEPMAADAVAMAL